MNGLIDSPALLGRKFCQIHWKEFKIGSTWNTCWFFIEPLGVSPCSRIVCVWEPAVCVSQFGILVRVKNMLHTHPVYIETHSTHTHRYYWVTHMEHIHTPSFYPALCLLQFSSLFVVSVFPLFFLMSCKICAILSQTTNIRFVQKKKKTLKSDQSLHFSSVKFRVYYTHTLHFNTHWLL